MKKLILIPVLAMVTGCGVLFPTCSEEQRPAVSLTVVDSVTRNPLPVESVVSAIDGSYTSAEQLPANTSAAAGLALERPGMYRVRVEVEGYETWEKGDVRVTETDDGCHVETVELTAWMQPE